MLNPSLVYFYVAPVSASVMPRRIFVIPAKVGTQSSCKYWIPAFAGMTGNIYTKWRKQSHGMTTSLEEGGFFIHKENEYICRNSDCGFQYVPHVHIRLRY